MIDLREALGSAFRVARTAARAGEYQLLLGAGASVGATNVRGALPTSEELVRILKHRFPKAPIAEGDALSRSYQRALMVSSEVELWKLLREIFTGATHADWFTRLAGLPWRRVWTLNVDDAFENAYIQSIRAPFLKHQSVSWEDPYSETGLLEVVHLHGHVLGSEPRRLVFSFSEYQSAARERPVWDQIIGGTLSTRPVVAFGARLLGDPDVESLYVSNRPTTPAPSIIVDPYISEGNKWELTRLGYRVLQCHGEDFVNAWTSEFDLDEGALASLYDAVTVDLPQIVRLQTNHVPPAPARHNFFGGDEPLWADACARRPALLEWMRETVSAIEQWLEVDHPDPVVHLLYGERLTGISTGLLVIAREARSRHVETVSFDKSSRLNVPRFIDFCRRRGPVLLIIDGGADFGNDIDEVAKEAAEDPEVSLYVLISERPNNDLRVEGRLTGRYRKFARRVKPQLGRSDASAIATKLAEHGRLGSLEQLDGRGRIAHFRGRDVFSAMLEVELAPGFRRRLEDEVRALDAPWKQRLLVLLAFAALEARDVGVVEASFAVGMPSNKIMEAAEVDGHLAALMEIVGDRLVSRQRDKTVSPLVQSLGEANSLRMMLSIIKGLSPLATRQSLRQRNRAAVLVGHLMNARQLLSTFPGSDLDAFYDELRETFGTWNGRYWEQRAIYAKHSNDWARAESFAGRAVSLYDDAYTRTTYGTILINKAQSLVTEGDESWFRYYERGKDQFNVALQQEPGNRVTAFAFLEAALALLTKLANSEYGKGPDVAAVADDWRTTYTSLRLSLTDVSGFESITRAESLASKFEKLDIV